MVDITDESYPLARELASFSRADYSHARRVMLVAARCAAVVGADERVCSAAGMYYRIGVLEGAPLAKNGVKMAQRACFPEKVIRIIGEYNGEEALPSTIESAIVHMVDGLLKKLEVLDADFPRAGDGAGVLGRSPQNRKTAQPFSHLRKRSQCADEFFGGTRIDSGNLQKRGASLEQAAVQRI